jgi:hypothetical protein
MPTKAIYESFTPSLSRSTKERARRADLDFDFYLTDRLKLGTVSEMRARMSHFEYQQWKIWISIEAQKQQAAQGGG